VEKFKTGSKHASVETSGQDTTKKCKTLLTAAEGGEKVAKIAHFVFRTFPEHGSKIGQPNELLPLPAIIVLLPINVELIARN
jgi:hypothetical protein